MPLHLALGNRESYAGWLEFLRGMVARGLQPPLTMTSDGAPDPLRGCPLRALDEVFPRSVRIRCWMHKMQNVLGKLPEAARSDVKTQLQAVRDAPTLEEGRAKAAQVIEMYERTYPAAMKSFADDLEASLAHLRVPPEHRKFVRTTNLIERAFGEERRRTKVIPRFFDERSCLKLAFAALERAARGWQRIHISEAEQGKVAALRRALGLEPRVAVTVHHHQQIAA